MKVPDKSQTRQAISAVLQVSSSKHNAKKSVRVCMCVSVEGGGGGVLTLRL